MALQFQTTLRWASEVDFDALADVMFAAMDSANVENAAPGPS
jgi:hypothetical protein